ncbi:MAG: hypothetical protein MUE40_02570 [Anaerolineae bacterium]|jgi:hypothetical protein|nr:hypothetical protein [Anaerolineae bacterium]
MRRLLLCSLLALLLHPLAAQESTPEALPQSPLITLEQDFTFPQRLYSRMTIDVPTAQIDRTQLVIQPQDSAEIIIDFGPAAAGAAAAVEPYEFAGEYTVATYTWTIPPASVPPLFGTIRYLWRVRTQSGAVEEYGAEVQYSDTRTTWQTLATDRVSVTLPAGFLSADQARGLPVRLQTLYERLQSDTDRSPMFRWLIYPAGLPPACDLNADGEPIIRFLDREGTFNEVPCAVAVARAAYERAGYTVLQPATAAALPGTLSTLLIDAFYAPLWADSDVPAWFQRGLAALYQPATLPGTLFSTRQALQNARPLTLAELSAPPTAENEARWAAQSYSLMLYLLDRLGVPAVFNLARRAAAGSFAEAYTAAAGSLETLIPDWQTWLYTGRAEAAYSYSIYQPTTATPTATFTPTITRTPLPPTATLTATAAVTATPRPTRTRIPPTATLTPLPPQGFSLRPTAIPATPVPPVSYPLPGVPVTTPQWLVIGMVGLVLALLLVLFRRRSP